MSLHAENRKAAKSNILDIFWALLPIRKEKAKSINFMEIAEEFFSLLSQWLLLLENKHALLHVHGYGES